MVHDIGEDIQQTRGYVKKMVKKISIKFVGQIPGVDTSDIPLHPKKANYPNVQFWKRGSWLSIRNNTAVKNSDAPVLKLFMEDEFGNDIPDDIRDELLNDMKGFWNDKLASEVAYQLKPYSKLGMEMRNAFRVALEGKYPWLRLCYGHWKAYQLWVNYFSSWARSHLPSASPIVISDDSDNCEIIGDQEDDDDKPSSAGSKCGREDSEEEPRSPKKHKGKAREVASPVSHPQRPKPKKTKVKVARVSNTLF